MAPVSVAGECGIRQLPVVRLQQAEPAAMNVHRVQHVVAAVADPPL